MSGDLGNAIFNQMSKSNFYQKSLNPSPVLVLHVSEPLKQNIFETDFLELLKPQKPRAKKVDTVNKANSRISLGFAFMVYMLSLAKSRPKLLLVV